MVNKDKLYDFYFSDAQRRVIKETNRNNDRPHYRNYFKGERYTQCVEHGK